VAPKQAAELLVHLYECYTLGDCDLPRSTFDPHADNKVHALDAK